MFLFLVGLINNVTYVCNRNLYDKMERLYISTSSLKT